MIPGRCAGLLLIAGLHAMAAQSTAPVNAGTASGRAEISFRYENSQLQPGSYYFVIAEDGSGQFHSEPGSTPPSDTASYHPLATTQDRSVQISKPVVDQLFSTARSQKLFSIPCEDKKNKVAFQGTKQLKYRGPEGSGSCTYNWSKIVAIQKITSTLESIAFTLEEGRRLEVEHKHDRLALDAELGVLVDAAKDGRALELLTIQSTLQAIIDDEAVLERARSRARKLLGDPNVIASMR